jgi:DNA-directed RNA polymerase subunit RPC12/RpoP
MSSSTLYRCDKCHAEFTSLETLREHKAAGCKK